MEYRVALADVERAVTVETKLIVALEPEESLEHLTLRLLAWCLLYRPELDFARGPFDAHAADLWAHDLTGRVALWVECGAVTGDKLRRVTRHQRGADVHVVLADAAARDALAADLARHPAGAPVALWTVDGDLVARIAALDVRRHTWSVTLVGDHVYIDADGLALDGAVRRATL
jgi:uncharacterized protein YaeQ